MPKKLNFLGGMQNYDPKTGEYEPDLKGPDGERPTGFSKDKSQHDKINDKRMGKNAIGYGEEEVNQLKDDALKFLKGSLTEEEFDAVKDNEQLLNDYASGKYSVGDVKLVAKNKLEGVDNQDVEENSEEDKSFESVNAKRMGEKTKLDKEHKELEKQRKRVEKFMPDLDSHKQMLKEMDNLLKQFDSGNRKEEALSTAKSNIKEWQRNRLLDTNPLRDEKLVYFNKIVEYMENNL